MHKSLPLACLPQEYPKCIWPVRAFDASRLYWVCQDASVNGAAAGQPHDPDSQHLVLSFMISWMLSLYSMYLCSSCHHMLLYPATYHNSMPLHSRTAEHWFHGNWVLVTHCEDSCSHADDFAGPLSILKYGSFSDQNYVISVALCVHVRAVH